MWDFVQSYQIWIMMAIVIAILLFGRVGGMGCGGHGGHGRYPGERRRTPQGSENEEDEETVGAPPNGRPHHCGGEQTHDH